MPISILDDSLKVEVYFDRLDCEFDDNICMCMIEDCPHEEKVLKADETNIYLTAEQALKLGNALIEAATESLHYCTGV